MIHDLNADRVIARRATLLGFVSLAAAASTAHAQLPRRRARIGILVPLAPNAESITALRKRLRELGYIEPETLELLVRSADGRFDQLPTLARELVEAKVDLIVTASSPATRAAVNATNTIPIVIAAAGDVVGAGFAKNLARPGGNVTGLTLMMTDLREKQLDFLMEIFPSLTRIATLAPPRTTGDLRNPAPERIAAEQHGIEIKSYVAETTSQIERAFANMVMVRSEALILIGGPALYRHKTLIANLSTVHRLPYISTARSLIDFGALASYGASETELWARSAEYVDKIVKGRRPEELPIEQPTRLYLTINLRVARALGIDIPAILMARADEIIE